MTGSGEAAPTKVVLDQIKIGKYGFELWTHPQIPGRVSLTAFRKNEGSVDTIFLEEGETFQQGVKRWFKTRLPLCQ